MAVMSAPAVRGNDATKLRKRFCMIATCDHFWGPDEFEFEFKSEEPGGWHSVGYECALTFAKGHDELVERQDWKYCVGVYRLY